MKLILAEKPAAAENIAHSLGARERLYSGNAMCYKGNDYYVAFAKGHLYGIGVPENYGYSKSYKMEELPILPDEFKLYPSDRINDSLRELLTTLLNKSDITEIICATDAGREGELIFRQIYHLSGCKKPVKRLWINDLTDETIRNGINNLKDDSDYDGMYEAAFAREKCDWIIGINLSRLYSLQDNYPHKIGRVKTPLLNIIVERDTEIKNFVKSSTWKLMLDNGAVSDIEFNSIDEASSIKAKNTNKPVTVIEIETTENKDNRPLLFSLNSLQREGNDIFGYTANEILTVAQSLYEKKMISYPRTDSEYLNDGMVGTINNVVNKLKNNVTYEERISSLLANGLNIDKRVLNSNKSSEHHAIIPTGVGKNNLGDKERNLYELIVNRFLCILDKQYVYLKTKYKFWSEDVTYTLEVRKPIELGWKKYKVFNPEIDTNTIENDIPIYHKGDNFNANISIKEYAKQPKKHFTDSSLISVMENIDNRISDGELKNVIKGKGIGTVATRATIIEQLVSANYIKRDGKQIVATEFGIDFINSIPNSIKSAERTAEWEQRFDMIQSSNSGGSEFYSEVADFVKSVISYEMNRKRISLKHTYINTSRTAIGQCPRCGKNIYEGNQNYYCESGKDGCGFVLWKESKVIKDVITAAKAKKLICGEKVELKAVNMNGDVYSAFYKLKDEGKYINLERQQAEKISLGKCPRCGNDVYEGGSNYYCDSVKTENKCGFYLKKDDTYNRVVISAKQMKDLLSKNSTVVKRKMLDGNDVSITFELVDTGKYINLKKKE